MDESDKLGLRVDPGGIERWIGVGTTVLRSPSLRTGRAVLPHPALQKMGSDSETVGFELHDRLEHYRLVARAAVRLNSPASSKKRFGHRRLSNSPLALPFRLIRLRRMLRNRPSTQLSRVLSV
jgi:hypothetical protein